MANVNYEQLRKEVVPQYNLHNSDKDKHAVISFFPKDHLSLSAVLRLKNFAQQIERMVILVDVNDIKLNDKINTLSESYKDSKPLFIFLPRFELKQLFGDTYKGHFTFSSGTYQTSRLRRQIENYTSDLFYFPYISDGRDYATSNIRYSSDEDGCASEFAKIGKNYIFVNFTCFFKTTLGNGEKSCSGLVEHLLQDYIRWYNPRKKEFDISPEERYLQQKTKEYIHLIQTAHQIKINLVEREIIQAQQDMQSQYKGINRLEQVVREKTLTLNGIRAIRKEELDTFHKSENVKEHFKSLIHKEGFKTIEFGDNIFIETEPIHIESYGKKYHVGSFHITINLDGTIMIENFTNHKSLDNGSTRLDHPHVQNKQACFGNYKEFVAQQCAKGEYLTLFSTLLAFLKEYNDGRFGGAPFQRLEKLWGEPEDWNNEFCMPSRHPELIRKLNIRKREEFFREKIDGSIMVKLSRGTCDKCGHNQFSCLLENKCNRCDDCFTRPCSKCVPVQAQPPAEQPTVIGIISPISSSESSF